MGSVHSFSREVIENPSIGVTGKNKDLAEIVTPPYSIRNHKNFCLKFDFISTKLISQKQVPPALTSP